jgi:hypothetical protein
MSARERDVEREIGDKLSWQGAPQNTRMIV